MKKISKILLTLIISLFATNIVKAEECKDLVMYYKDGLFNNRMVQMNYGSSLEQKMLYLQDSSGANYPVYCRNAAKSTGARVGGTSYKCTSVVFDSTTASLTTDLKKIYEAGVIKILVDGYSANNNKDGVMGYTYTDLAIKTYELLWPSSINTNNSNNGTQTDYLKAFQYFANKMLDDNDVKAKLQEAAGSVRSKYANIKEIKSWEKNGEQIEENAKKLILAGLDEAIRYKKFGAASITWNDNPVISQGAMLGTGEGNGPYTGSMSYSFKLNGFTSNGTYANVKFTCPNCKSNGVSYIVNVNGKEVGDNYTDNINLLDYVTNGTGEVTLKIDFSGNSNTYECEELDYKLDVNYFDETIGNQVYELYSGDSDCRSGNCQHMYVLKNGSSHGAKNISIEGSYSMCNVSCTELRSRCNAAGNNSKACQEYKKQYPEGCINCGVGLVNNECSDPGATSKLDLIEGYEIDPENCTQGTSANIKGCIIDNSDVAGNSYNSGLGNGYCSVYCKEDFHFTLPGNLDVSSGRYFTLQVDITGTKTCYLQMHGSREKVIEDLKEKACETVQTYNSYQYQKSLALSTNTCEEEEVSNTHTIPGYCASGYGPSNSTYSECIDNYESSDCSCNNYVPGKSITCTYKKITCKTSGYTTYDCDGNASFHEGIKLTLGYEGWDAENLVCNSKDGVMPDSDTRITDVIDEGEKTQNEYTDSGSVHEYTIPGMDGAKAYVGGGGGTYFSGGSGKSIYNAIGAWNACAVWEMDYDFNPDMYFNYEESYMKDVLTDKLDLVGNITKGDIKKQYCSSDTDNSYELCNGSKTGWSNAPIFGSEKVFMCTTGGCSWESFQVNSTQRMKESIDFSASYITPTQFYTIYPTGAIVAARSASGIENSSELTNALPVGLGTPQGIHHYALYAKNLGEYYENGEFGRIWGDKNSVVSVTLKSTNKCINKGALKYDASLNGTYIDKGVWVCDYCVNGNCGYNTCTKPDGSTVDMTSCLKKYSKDYCEASLCPNNNNNTCTKEDGSKVDITSCLKDYSKDYCKASLCPNDNNSTCTKPDGSKVNITSCLKTKTYDQCIASLCPESCPTCPLSFKCLVYHGNYYGKNETIVSEQKFREECGICPDCPVECPTCIYNNGRNFNYRAISTNNLNPNNRNLGANWSYDDNQINTALEMKSKITTEEIITDGETIYDESTNKYVMKVKMDSAMINKIKNRDNKDYTANTLKCYDYTQDGKTYNNIFCYSTYIDKLLSESKTKDKITFSAERPYTEAQRKNSQSSNYWTTWTKKLEGSKWSISTTRELSYYKSNYDEIGIGPSWK